MIQGIYPLARSRKYRRHGRKRMRDVSAERRTRFDSGRFELSIRPFPWGLDGSLAAAWLYLQTRLIQIIGYLRFIHIFKRIQILQKVADPDSLKIIILNTY